MKKTISLFRIISYESKKVQEWIQNSFDISEQSHFHSYADGIEVAYIEFLVHGRKGVGFFVRPKFEIPNQAIMYCRGGTGEFGKLNIAQAFVNLGEFAHRRYAVFAPQYAGNGGSEGKDEIGGQDLEDVLIGNVIFEEILGRMPEKIGIFAESRGAVMAYKALCSVSWIHALVVRGGLSDLESVQKLRPEMKDAWAPHFPQTLEEYSNRSVICWTDKLPRNVPILLLHGLCDWRVSPLDSLNLSKAFLEQKIPHRLICFENADHALTQVSQEAWNVTFEWFERFLVNHEPLPRVGEADDSR